MWNCSTSWGGLSDDGFPLLQYSDLSSSRWLQFPAKENASDESFGSGGIRSPKLARLEAVLFVADSPLSANKIADAAKLIDATQCQDLIEDLNILYDAEESSFRVEQIASGYQLLTRPEFSQWLDRIHHRNVELKLTAPALETLTIIAYRQQITRADVEAIRGVQSSEVIKQLMERQLIRIGGEEDSLGRPYLYETTNYFLQYLGVRRIEQLPNYQQFREDIKGKEVVEVVEEESDEDYYDEDEIADESESEAA